MCERPMFLLLFSNLIRFSKQNCTFAQNFETVVQNQTRICQAFFAGVCLWSLSALNERFVFFVTFRKTSASLALLASSASLALCVGASFACLLSLLACFVFALLACPACLLCLLSSIATCSLVVCCLALLARLAHLLAC